MNEKKKGNGAERKTSEILKEYMAKMNISQTELAKLCTAKGYQVTQSSVSKVINNTKKMSIEECRAFCDALNISADILLFPNTRRTMSTDSFFLLSDEERQSAKGILGEYTLFFASTAEEERKRIIDGNLKLYEGDACIHAEIDINIRNSDPKHYKGYLRIGNPATVAYIIVKRMPQGEISVLAFRYRDFQKERMQCRTALCLTTSAGEKKEPLIHRVALIRRGTVSESVKEALINGISVFLKTDICYRLEVGEDMKMYQQLTGIREEEYE